MGSKLHLRSIELKLNLTHNITLMTDVEIVSYLSDTTEAFECKSLFSVWIWKWHAFSISQVLKLSRGGGESWPVQFSSIKS